jgi:Protein of unknown function (DUF2905)
MVGIMITIAGAVVWLMGAIPGVGRLPGDIYIRRGNFSFYFPVVTCIVLSIIATIVFSILRR